MKKCPKCGTEKPLEDFWSDRTKPDGRMSHCTTCKREYNALHVERDKATRKEWRAIHSDTLKEQNRKWRLAHPDYWRERRAREAD